MTPLRKLLVRARTISNRSLALLACSSVITTGAIVGGALTGTGIDDAQAVAAALAGMDRPAEDAPASDQLAATTDPSASESGPSATPDPGPAPADAPPPTTAPSEAPPPTDDGTTDDGSTDDGSTDDPAAPTSPFGHVFVVSLASPGYERSFGGSSEMPYLANKLRPQGTLLENYSLLAPGPLPNYVAMVGGQRPNDLTTDGCPTYREFPGNASPDDKGFVDGEGCVYPVLALSVADQVAASAGDLADPHGTHKKCTDAVLAAIDEEKKAGAEWLKDCRIWMYRGAWAEWEIENIEMCVPLSPEELRAKRNSILKHQSQMESAPFLGNDERLFWQRAEDRNRGTAQLYDELGLACYEAMEAFVEYIPL